VLWSVSIQSNIVDDVNTRHHAPHSSSTSLDGLRRGNSSAITDGSRALLGTPLAGPHAIGRSPGPPSRVSRRRPPPARAARRPLVPPAARSCRPPPARAARRPLVPPAARRPLAAPSGSPPPRRHAFTERLTSGRLWARSPHPHPFSASGLRSGLPRPARALSRGSGPIPLDSRFPAVETAFARRSEQMDPERPSPSRPPSTLSENAALVYSQRTASCNMTARYNYYYCFAEP
jgi:hypothetical protein